MAISIKGVTVLGRTGFGPVVVAYVPPANYSLLTSLFLTGDSTNGSNNNTFIDSSTNNALVTRFGTPTQGSFSPFSPVVPALYSPSLHGGSMYFAGAGDYLQLANTAGLQLGNLGTFTLELFCNLTSTNPAMLFTGYSEGGPYNGWALCYNRNGAIGQFEFYDGGGWHSFGTGYAINTWHHIAIVNSGGPCSLYINGNQVVTFLVSAGINNTPTPLTIGRLYNSSAFDVQGYISNLRVVNGTALYSGATITVPTSPLTAVANTKLLLNGTNAGIFDSTSKNDIKTLGTVQISTSVSKSGSGSMRFNSPIDQLVLPGTTDLSFASDFTVEFWVNATNINSGNYQILLAKGYGIQLYMFPTAGYIAIACSSSNSGSYFINATSALTIASGVWSHVAFVKNGQSYTLYLNGISTYSVSTSNIINTGTSPLLIGCGAGALYPFNGYMDNLRITNSALYTANFTPV